MKIEELRIGNYGNTNGVDVCLKMQDIYEFYLKKRDIKPIPIDENTLPIVGFHYQSSKNGITYYINYKTGFVLMYSYGNWSWSPSLGITSGKTLKYIHEIQNLHFSLTGEELTIK